VTGWRIDALAITVFPADGFAVGWTRFTGEVGERLSGQTSVETRASHRRRPSPLAPG